VARAYLQNIAPGFKAGAEALCRYASVKSGDRVLDIACGPGTTSFAALALGAEVTGVDSAKGMIEVAQDQARAQRGNITFLEGDLQQLPVPDASFDVALSSFGIVFAVAPRHAVGEIVRVLAPGGRMALLVWPRGGTIGRYFELLSKHLPQPEAPDHHRWADLDLLRSWLGDAFGPITSTTVELPFTAKSPEAAWETLRTSSSRTVLAYGAMAPEAKAALDRDMVAFFRTFKTPDGTIRWPRKALMVRATKQAGKNKKETTSELPRSIVSVLVGYLALAVLAMATTGLAGVILLGSTATSLSTPFVIVSLVFALLAAGAGGWLTARLAPSKPWYHLAALAVLAMIPRPLSGSVGPGPGWYHLAVAGVGILGVLVGGVVKLGWRSLAALKKS
jgi:SAM-dependent methyltransferase